MKGGRTEAEKLLAKVDPEAYSRTRNHLNGAVTKLAAYIRHGVLTLEEVRQKVLKLPKSEKLVTELAWRDYWQRVYAELGDGIWKDRESYKTGWRAGDYSEELPEDLRIGETGLKCMDEFSRELERTGYLHNHARMWVASYLIHWRRIRWQAGAAWFLEHLLDGDPASNNLSWQWVASTFSVKPYIFNRDNLEQFTDGVYCRSCQFRTEACPFAASYDELQRQLFPKQEGRQ